jgi:hypothetical protein
MSALTGRPAAVLMTISSLALLLGACAAPTPMATPQMAPLHAAPAVVHLHGLKDLTGLRPSEIAAILGPPDLRREESPAQLWQYRTPDCILNLFFYREGDIYRLVRAETWQRNLAGGAQPARCHDENAPVRARTISSPAL